MDWTIPQTTAAGIAPSLELVQIFSDCLLRLPVSKEQDAEDQSDLLLIDETMLAKIDAIFEFHVSKIVDGPKRIPLSLLSVELRKEYNHFDPHHFGYSNFKLFCMSLDKYEVFENKEHKEILYIQKKISLQDSLSTKESQLDGNTTMSASNDTSSVFMNPDMSREPTTDNDNSKNQTNSINQDSSVRLASLLDKFAELAQMGGRYFLCDHSTEATVSNWLHTIPLSLTDRYSYIQMRIHHFSC
jgi:hypothetical protein